MRSALGEPEKNQKIRRARRRGGWAVRPSSRALPALARRITALTACLFAAAAPAAPRVLEFDRPADEWEGEVLPIGNGAMGAAVTGGVRIEHLQFNEKTLWTGGPGSYSGYDHGLPPEPATAALAEVQALIARGGSLPPEAAAERLGREVRGYGAYQSFGSVVLELEHPLPAVDYRRALDLADGVASVRYRAGGTGYVREYFASYPDRVIVIHLRADRPGRLAFDVALEVPGNRSASFAAHADGLRVHGALDDNGLAYAAELGVIPDGGRVVVREGEGLRVENATRATLVLAAATAYDAGFPEYRGDDPGALVRQRVERAREHGYAALLARHRSDHDALFGRVRLDLGGAAPAAPIDRWLASYGSGEAAADRALESLYFQYGRYLLIASSRAGSLPANLQGVWNRSATPPWNADYHVNINLQMNYWPAEVTNLPETAAPLFDFVDSLAEPGRLAAKRLLGARGWTVFLNTNAWGFSGVIDWPTAFWQPEAGAWLAQHYYEHYLFSGDEAFLRERAWPAMKGAAQTWLDALVTDPRDGSLVVSPSYSPEHGDFTAGAAMSQQIVAELFATTGKAARVVGDAAFARELAAARARLDPGLAIGSWGQLREWKEDLDDPEDRHRHVSHLYALYPGRALHPARHPELFADRKSVV